jgi:NAD(P)-dependent dehydrogenase (short-subunit alcohol dehydrogenase family)
MEKILSRKIAIITGANQGLGLEIAKKFIICGADLMICARDKNKLENAKNQLMKLASTKQRILSCVADISIEKDVNLVVSETINQLGGCHILVNNAGIYGPKNNIELINWQDWIKTIEVNLYGSILMCRALIENFKKQGYGKIIQLSGGGATNPLPNLSAYAVSKAAIVRFTETLAEELRGTGIDVNSIAPGALNTRMLDEILEAGPLKVGQSFYERSLKQKKDGGVSLEKGADLAVFLASEKSDGITAKLISAIWDNWKQWPSHIKELDNTDAYTLRRITGKDRNIKWGDI